MRLVWLLALLTSHADGACNYVKPNEGLWQGSTCDSLWETNNLTCSFLVRGSGTGAGRGLFVIV